MSNQRDPYNAYNQRGAGTAQPQGNYYSPTYGSPAYGAPANTGYGNQGKAYEGGKVNPYQGGNTGAAYGNTQGTNFDLHHDNNHYHPPSQEGCFSLLCLLIFDLLFLLVLTGWSIYSALAGSSTGWLYWIIVALNVITLCLAIYLTIVACGHERTDGTRTTFNIYKGLRITIGVLAAIVSVISLIIAIILWSGPGKTDDATLNEIAGAVSSILGWIFFISFLFYGIFAAWFLATIGCFNRAVDAHHQHTSSLH